MIELEEKLTQVQMQLCGRERELNESSERICELTKKVHKLELENQMFKHERDTIRKELEGEKNLCSKLDIEIEKLNAEVREYSDIRQDVSC